MSKDMPTARNIIQHSKLHAQKKEQREGFARNFFWTLGCLAVIVLILITGLPEVVEWSLWSVVGNLVGFIGLTFGLGLLFALMFSGFYEKLSAVEERQLHSRELEDLNLELKSHPACLELLQEELARYGAIRITVAARTMIEAGVFRP